MVEHKPTRRGPGIPACTCGEVFEWNYERADHVLRNQKENENENGLQFTWGSNGLTDVRNDK